MWNVGSSLGSGQVRFAFAVLLVSGLIVAAPGNGTAQQSGQGQYVVEAAARLSKLVGAANKAGYEFQSNNFSVGGGWLKQSQKNWVPLYTVTLQAGKRYRFIAAGDADARDVDLEIKDASGRTVKADASTDPEAVVDYSPETTGKYLVRVRLYQSKDDVDCLCLAVVMSSK
jgi:hypothetical protein